MKNNKGITLTSLVIYIVIVFAITAAVMRITTYFSNNMTDVADVSFETEFNKLNLYLLDESKKVGNDTLELVEGNTVSFLNGNNYTYKAEDKAVFFNDSVKICENVESCLFEKKIAPNGRNIMELKIKISDVEKTVQYVMSGNREGNIAIEEENYIIEKGNKIERILNNSSYQQVEYIKATGEQYIDTGLKLNSNTKAEIKFYYENNTNEQHICLLCCRDADMNNTFTIWAKTKNATARYDYQSNVYDGVETSVMQNGEHVVVKDKNLNYLDGIQQTSNTQKTFSCKYNATLFASNNAGESVKNFFTGRCYYCRIWDNGKMVRYFVPCYRKADNVAGLYDIINNVFYTNLGTGNFVLGPEVKN